MKKFILFIAFTALFSTLFSCTADEYETQPKKKITMAPDPDPEPEGPGEVPKPPVKP